MNLSLPLDYLYPEEYGDFDEEQQSLICNLEALDLVLIENASELLRRTIQDKNNIELILKAITRNEPTVKYLDSETFPFYVKEENLVFYEDYITNIDNEVNELNSEGKNITRQEYLESLKQEYEKIVKSYQKKLNPKFTYVSIVAVNIEGVGGHYAAFYYKNGEVSVFDSMQGEIEERDKKLYEKKYGKRVLSAAGYTPYFMQLISDIFSNVPRDKITAPECIRNEMSVQFTGGFAENPPYVVEKAKKERKINKREMELLKVQHTDSQNHFCYLWAIFWLHLKIIGRSLDSALPRIQVADPLVTIKRYAWFLVYFLGLNKQIKYLNFFEKHFMSIWSNMPNKLSLTFKRYDIPHPRITKDINDAIVQSIQKVPLQKQPNTVVPDQLCNFKKRRK